MSIRGNVDAQALTERVRVERKSETRTASGALQSTWTPVTECWARVDGAKVGTPEPFFEGATQTQRNYVVWVRADIVTRFGVTPVDRLIWLPTRKGAPTRVFDIVDIPDQGLRGRLMGMVVRAGINKG